MRDIEAIQAYLNHLGSIHRRGNILTSPVMEDLFDHFFYAYEYSEESEKMKAAVHEAALKDDPDALPDSLVADLKICAINTALVLRAKNVIIHFQEDIHKYYDIFYDDTSNTASLARPYYFDKMSILSADLDFVDWYQSKFPSLFFENNDSLDHMNSNARLTHKPEFIRAIRKKVETIRHKRLVSSFIFKHKPVTRSWCCLEEEAEAGVS